MSIMYKHHHQQEHIRNLKINNKTYGDIIKNRTIHKKIWKVRSICWLIKEGVGMEV